MVPSARVDIQPDKVDIVTGYGCSYMAFGSAFILVGLFALVFVTNSAEHAKHHSILERVLAGGVGFVFMLVGAFFGFCRNGTTVDGATKIINKWIGFRTFRFETEKYPFEDFSRYAIEQTGSHTFAVVLQGGTTAVTLLTAHSYSTAQEQAEKVAVVLPLELHDEVEST